MTSCVIQRLFQSTLPARGATRTYGGGKVRTKFQSTLPARGATSDNVALALFFHISIHAPRTGSDQGAVQKIKPLDNFNPRSPHGERHCRPLFFLAVRSFQSTLPARGATNSAWRKTSVSGFQSTLPARGATLLDNRQGVSSYFNPRSPHGERRAALP